MLALTQKLSLINLEISSALISQVQFSHLALHGLKIKENSYQPNCTFFFKL